MPFKERVLDGSPAAADSLAAVAGTGALPVIMLGQTALVGFDKDRLATMLDLYRPPRSAGPTESPGAGAHPTTSSTLARDLALAQRVHRSFLPPDTEYTHLDVAVRVRPHIVGGDYASVGHAPDGRYYLAVSDVTGHGIASALLVSRVNAFVMGQLHQAPQPSALVKALNEFLCTHFDGLGLFLTFFCARIDAGAGTLEYCGAGHPPGLLVRPDADPVWLCSESPPLGVSRDIVQPGQASVTSLHPGEVLVLHTDGVLEARSAGAMSFGPGRLLAALHQGLPNGVAAAAESVLSAVAQHEPGTASDDRLVLVARFRG